MNGSHRHWRARWAWSREWRTRTASLARATLNGQPGTTEATAPKLVQFTAHVWSRFDDDGLRAALKPVRDGLADAGLLHHDSPGSGHVFRYGQVIDRRHRGIAVLATHLAAPGKVPAVGFAEEPKATNGSTGESAQIHQIHERSLKES